MAKKVPLARELEPEDTEILSGFIEEEFPDGLVSPRSLLEKARPKNSPVHRFFEWDDGVAAEHYRLEQARRLIRCLVVKIDGKPTRKYVTPIYVEAIDKSVYTDVRVAMNDNALWEQVVERALKEANHWRERYLSYEELGGIHKAIEKTQKQWAGRKLKEKKK